MALHLRLKRIGKNPKKRPHFRIAVYEETRGRDSRCIEELGFYNPVSEAVKLKKERIEFWIKRGAQLSQTLRSIVKKANKRAQT